MIYGVKTRYFKESRLPEIVAIVRRREGAKEATFFNITLNQVDSEEKNAIVKKKH